MSKRNDNQNGNSLYRKGQAAIVIALSMVLLIAIVGLAVDGGSMYQQRRVAQNSADAAALASTQVMLKAYEQMVTTNPDGDIDGGADVDTTIYNTLASYAGAHGIMTGTLQAYYVNDAKEIVTTAPVGSLGYVPWNSSGVKGITVKNTANTDAFFMKVLGYNTVSANATATAFMGLATSINRGVALLPVGFFTNTTVLALNQLLPGQRYTLIDGDQESPGNWGYINFNGDGDSSPAIQAWMACGYDPSIRTEAEWNLWCSRGDQRNIGPTKYWTGEDSPDNGPFTDYSLRWGSEARGYKDGWWLLGSSGRTTSQCNYLADISVDREYLVPVFERDTISGTGANSKFHLLDLALFKIDTADIVCSGSNAHWHIIGTYLQRYIPGGPGTKGNMRHSSLHTVILDN